MYVFPIYETIVLELCGQTVAILPPIIFKLSRLQKAMAINNLAMYTLLV